MERPPSRDKHAEPFERGERRAYACPMFGSTVLAEIQRLDPVRDHQRIVFLSCRVDFPFDTTRSLELALFRTYCAPNISGLLHATREFESCPQKRYDDTDLIVSEMMEHGYDSARGAAALERMNEIHGRFHIQNEDFLYVLSTFIFEPIRWNARFGWRRMTRNEELSMFHFWRAIGERMHIRDIPHDYAELERYNRDYEREHFRFAESNRRIGTATRELFLSWLPRWTRPLARPCIHAALDDTLIEAFGFPRPPAWMRRLVEITLKTRARVLRLLPAPRRAVLRTEMRPPSYPDGYRISELGPPPPGRSD